MLRNLNIKSQFFKFILIYFVCYFIKPSLALYTSIAYNLISFSCYSNYFAYFLPTFFKTISPAFSVYHLFLKFIYIKILIFLFNFPFTTNKITKNWELLSTLPLKLMKTTLIRYSAKEKLGFSCSATTVRICKFLPLFI